jgi:hypothetical protein
MIDPILPRNGPSRTFTGAPVRIPEIISDDPFPVSAPVFAARTVLDVHMMDVSMDPLPHRRDSPDRARHDQVTDGPEPF